MRISDSSVCPERMSQYSCKLVLFIMWFVRFKLWLAAKFGHFELLTSLTLRFFSLFCKCRNCLPNERRIADGSMIFNESLPQHLRYCIILLPMKGHNKSSCTRCFITKFTPKNFDSHCLIPDSTYCSTSAAAIIHDDGCKYSNRPMSGSSAESFIWLTHSSRSIVTFSVIRDEKCPLVGSHFSQSPARHIYEQFNHQPLANPTQHPCHRQLVNDAMHRR